MRRRHAERCRFGNRINPRRYPDRRLLSGAKRPYSSQCRCKTRLAGNLDGQYVAGCDTASRRPNGPKFGGANRAESPQRSSSVCAELRGLPWFREGCCVAITDSKRPLSKATAIGYRWGRGRPRRCFVLENQARYSSDGHAFVRVLPQRPADLDACAFPEAHGQAAARGTADLAAGRELAGDVRGLARSEIAYSTPPAPLARPRCKSHFATRPKAFSVPKNSAGWPGARPRTLRPRRAG